MRHPLTRHRRRSRLTTACLCLAILAAGIILCALAVAPGPQ